MSVATRIPRYNKSQKLFIDEHEVTLIDHLKQLRIERKITKKKISNIIKQNDTWYSQIERNGKNGDDNRQKTIYRPDLINIISIVKFGANSITELGEYNQQSEIYIDKIMKAVPIQESLKALEWYQINNNRTANEQEVEDKTSEYLAKHKKSYLGTESRIHSLGYNVIKQYGYTYGQRKIILANIIENYNISKHEILSMLHMNISRKIGLPNYKDAVYKWKQDRDFIANYHTGDIPQVIVDKVIVGKRE